MAPVDKMPKPELMKYAASIGVATRKPGTKLYRRVDDVRADCKAREAAQQESPVGHAMGPGLASPSLPSASAPGDSSGAGGDEMACAAGAGGGGGAAHLCSDDVNNMGNADLRKLGSSLGVYSRKCKTNDALRAACKRALAGQTSLAGSFAAALPSQGGPDGQARGEEGGTAPVFDSVSAAAAKARPRCPLRRPRLRKKTRQHDRGAAPVFGQHPRGARGYRPPRAPT